MPPNRAVRVIYRVEILGLGRVPSLSLGFKGFEVLNPHQYSSPESFNANPPPKP